MRRAAEGGIAQRLASAVLVALIVPAAARAFEWPFGTSKPPDVMRAGKVVDAGNKPIPGVWVISKWTSRAAGSFVPTGCGLEVVRTDAHGRYALKLPETIVGTQSGLSQTNIAYFYAPGMVPAKLPGVGEPADVQKLVPDHRSTNARLMELNRIAAGIECQDYLENRKSVVWPIYQALNDEAVTIAKDKTQRLMAIGVTHWIHVLQSGYEGGNRATIAEREKLGDYSLR